MTKYEITVNGFNEVGHGPSGKVLVVRTLQSGKLAIITSSLCCIYCRCTRVNLETALRADVCKYQPEVCNSEKLKILKKIHSIARGKLLQEIHVLLQSDNYFRCEEFTAPEPGFRCLTPHVAKTLF